MMSRKKLCRCILDEGKRLDGRTTTQIRPIWCEVDYLPGLTDRQYLHVEKLNLCQQ